MSKLQALTAKIITAIIVLPLYIVSLQGVDGPGTPQHPINLPTNLCATMHLQMFVR